MLGLFFSRGPVLSLAHAQRSDRKRYARFFHTALNAGVYLPPSTLETAFVSAAYGPKEIERAGAALAQAFRSVAGRPS